MRDYRRTGREASPLYPSHIRQHEAAQARAAAMLALHKQGYSYHEIGQRMNCTAGAVRSALRKQGLA